MKIFLNIILLQVSSASVCVLCNVWRLLCQERGQCEQCEHGPVTLTSLLLILETGRDHTPVNTYGDILHLVMVILLVKLASAVISESGSFCGQAIQMCAVQKVCKSSCG